VKKRELNAKLWPAVCSHTQQANTPDFLLILRDVTLATITTVKYIRPNLRLDCVTIPAPSVYNRAARQQAAFVVRKALPYAHTETWLAYALISGRRLFVQDIMLG
jgi:hypothetical protein